MTLVQLREEGRLALEKAGVSDSAQDAQSLLLDAFGLDSVHFLLKKGDELEDSEKMRQAVSRYRDGIRRRCERIPLQQIRGTQAFMGLDFYVNEHVLIPRQDTETLVELVLEEIGWRKESAGPDRVSAGTGSGGFAAGAEYGSLLEDAERGGLPVAGSGVSVLDLCTGSGCIAISLAVLGRVASVTATDISEEALAVARENAGRLLPAEAGQEGWIGPVPAIRFFQGNLFAALPVETVSFDVIVSNPPYIPTAVIATLEPEVRDHEPVLALDGEEDGLIFYRRITAEAGAYLKPGGHIYLEIGYDQGAAVSGLLREAGFEAVRVHKDLPGHDRVVSAVWPGTER